MNKILIVFAFLITFTKKELVFSIISHEITGIG